MLSLSILMYIIQIYMLYIIFIFRFENFKAYMNFNLKIKNKQVSEP